MKTFFGLIAGAALAVSATAASAAVTVNAGGTTVLNPTQSTTINFDGFNNNSVIPGISSSLLLTFNGTNGAGTTYNFSYTLSNTSTVNPSEVSAFGFDVDPNISGATRTGAVLTGISSGSISNGQSVEFCLTSGNNCAGGASSGVPFNSSTSGTFALTFSSAPGNITLTNLLTRYQSFNVNGVGSGIGRPTGAVPEPGTWAMMLVGFGAVGYSMRRRKRVVLAAAA